MDFRYMIETHQFTDRILTNVLLRVTMFVTSMQNHYVGYHVKDVFITNVGSEEDGDVWRAVIYIEKA